MIVLLLLIVAIVLWALVVFGVGDILRRAGRPFPGWLEWLLLIAGAILIGVIIHG